MAEKVKVLCFPLIVKAFVAASYFISNVRAAPKNWIARFDVAVSVLIDLYTVAAYSITANTASRERMVNIREGPEGPGLPVTRYRPGGFVMSNFLNLR